DFRPVGLAVAPDGSLYATDWVLKDYTLHGKGAAWHIRWKDSSHPERPTDPKLALASRHRPLREAAARKLAGDDAGREFLREKLTKSGDVGIRAASLTALIGGSDANIDLRKIADQDSATGIRAMAIRALAAGGSAAKAFVEARYPAELRREAIVCLRTSEDLS